MRLDLEPSNPDLLELIDRLHLAVFTIDTGDRFAGWSDGAASITGFSSGEVVGQPLALLDTEAPRGISALVQRLRAADRPDFVNGLVTLRRKGGGEVTLLGDLRTIGEGVVGALTLLEPHLLNQARARVVPSTGARLVFHEMVGESTPMRRVFEELEQAAKVDVTVVVRGETGTGKELAARAIHALGKRKDRPLVCLNCSAIPDPLLESELFGHVRGAFPGATRDKVGVFEAADGGVLFLDEIGDLGPSVQVKLLRALQEREFRRVGETKTRKVDLRIVSATNRDLASMVASGTFREDLYYRIRVFELNLPPLRERSGDLPLLVDHMIQDLNRRHERTIEGLEPDALACLGAYDWPGNVRELRNAIEHAFVTARGARIGTQNLPPEIRTALAAAGAPAPVATDEAPLLPSDERSRIVSALREAGGRKAAAARLLGISRVTLWKKIKKLGINPIYLE